MSTALRTLVLLGAAAALAACSDETKPVADVLAEDSTLVREVMAANQDSLILPVDTALSATPEIASSEVAPKPAVAAGAKESITRSTRRLADRRASATRETTSRAKPRREGSQAISPEPTRDRNVASSASARIRATERVVSADPTPMHSSALIPAGSEIVLTSDQRVCASMSRTGDTFQARVAEDVVGPIGVVIPKGTPATAQVASVNKDFDLDIKSLSLAGRTYSIGSDATFKEIEKVRTTSRKRAAPITAGAGLGAAAGGVMGRDIKSAVIGAAGGAIAGALAARPVTRTDSCVPEGGRITMKLSEPLKIALSD